MRTYLSFFFLCFFAISFSQTKPFKISGSLIAESDKTPLESATIYLERIKDSSLVTYTISDKNGDFTLEDETSDTNLNLYISYVGFETYVKNITINSNEIDLQTIALKTDENVLDEVVIKSRAPITIKKDTLEFNVKSFKTKKDATVEDLLKQLPGVEVDEEGKILVNGKEVSKILVNGKPFFGDDPTITTRNLTKDIIEKVQITDTKTKAEAFAGEEGDKENKTINLTIKEENNKGTFGRFAAGAGTEKRYEFAGMINYFDNDQRISLLAGGNNINSPGFSFGEIRKMFGGANSMSMSSSGSFTIDGRSFGGGQGITRSQNYGANYADELSDKLEITADYFYSGSHSDNESLTERENILPDSRFFTDSESKSTNDNDNHSFNLGFDVEIDSTFLINIDPRFRFNKSINTFGEDEATRDVDDVLTNQSTNSTFSESTQRNLSNDLNLTKRFGSKGAFIRFQMDNEYNTTESDNFIMSETNIFGDNPETIIRDQFTDEKQQFKSFYASSTFRLPLKAKELFMDFTFSHRDDVRNNERSTFDRDLSTDEFSLFNEDLSTDFEYTNRRTTPGLRLSLQKEKISASIQGSYVFRTLKSNDYLRPELSLKRNFEAVELRTNFNYRFSPKASLYAGYSVNNTPPQLSQLQPFQNVANPLNIITGNPNLEPSNDHRIYAGYNAFDFQKRSGFYSYLSANFRNNQVVSKTTIDENFVRETTYINVDGNYNLSANASYNKDVKIDSLRTLKFGVGGYVSFNKNINFNNDIKYAGKVRTISPNASITFTWNKVLEIRPRYNISFSKNTYDIDDFEDREFLRHSLSLRATTYVPKNFEWQNVIEFSYNPNVAPGFQKSAWFWNSTLAYTAIKDKAIVTLKVYDLLNQNTNARRIATQNYIQDSQSTVLQQYFMLSFSWKFNTLGSKGKTDDNGGVFFFN